MEEQHPIPQQISAYQFRLVGDMTLKQFFQVAGGALVALLIYSSPLHPTLKWPAILVSFLFGVALAFFPIEDRPLDKWIFAFFKSIYSPTIYVWRQMKKKPTFFQPEKGAPPPSEQITTPLLPEEKVTEAEDVQIAPVAKALEKTEKEFLSRVSVQLGEPTLSAFPAALRTPVPTLPTDLAQAKTPRRVSVPEVEPAFVEKAKAEPEVGKRSMGPSTTVYMAPTPSVGQKGAGAVWAKFSLEAAPPSPPTKANIIVGQVMDAAGKIVDGAILEIKDEEGRPVRALKTNKLGHFMIVTPLVNGRYEIATEKEELEFNPVTFEAKGAMIPPMAIRAKGALNN